MLLFSSSWILFCILFVSLMPVNSLLFGVRPIAIRNGCSIMKRTKRGQSTSSSHDIQVQHIPLSSGVTAQVASVLANNNPNVPSLVFVHGSFHSSWCWEKHFMSFFAKQHHMSCYAICLRGTHGTNAGQGVTKVQIHQHVDDITAFLQWLSQENKDQPPPVLIGHSFGGLVVMKYLEQLLLSDTTTTDTTTIVPLLSGACVACSVPPSGNGPMTMRYIRRDLVASYKLTVGFAMKRVITNKSLCRELFVDSDTTDDEISEMQANFKRDSTATIDLIQLNQVLPSKRNELFRGTFVSKNATTRIPTPRFMVLGASQDFIVDKQGVLETADFFGVDPTWVESTHDFMLGKRWRNGAEAILKWLQSEVFVAN